MIFQFTRRRNSNGSTLGIALITTGIIGAALVSYLTMAKRQHQITSRSQTWNACIPVAEAGVEEALAHINANGTNGLGSQGWQLAGNYFTKANVVGSGKYRVTMTKDRPFEITAIGFYPMAGTGASLSRTVKVTTKDLSVFMGGVIARSSVAFNGNDVLIDSYDSRDSGKSSAGLYDPSKAGAKADLAYTGPIANLDVGNGNIWGHIYTSPGGSITTGPNGSVGSEAWNTGGNTGVEPEWHSTDLNYSFVEVVKPFVAGVPPTSGTVGGTYYRYILGDGEYEASSLGEKVLVVGDAVVYVAGDVKFTGQDRIDIQEDASLTLYCAGESVNFNEINNANKNSTSFQYYGLSSNKNIDFNGGTFYGAVYAPHANVKLNGTSEMYASVVANNFILNGNAAIHYDEALLDTGLSQGFVVDSWDEL
jgi:hypothetical protein